MTPPETNARSHAAWLTSGGVFQAGVSFASNLALVRLVDPAGFGRFALHLAAISLVLGVANLRLGQQIVRAREDELAGDARSRLANACVQEPLLLGLVAAGALALDGTSGAFGLTLLVALLARHAFGGLRSFFEREQPYRELAVIEGGAHLLAHAGAVVAALAGLGAASLVARELLLSALSLALLARAGGLPRFRWRLLRVRDWLALARGARGLWADGVAEGAFQRVVVLAAGGVGGTAGAGFFSQAQRLAFVPHQVLSPVAERLAYNRFSRELDPERRRRACRRLVLALSAPLALAAVLTVALAEPVVPLLFGERWRPAAGLLTAMAGFVLAATGFTTVKNLLLAERRTALVLALRATQFVGLAGGLALGLASESVGSLKGVALGVSFAYVLALAVAWSSTLGRRAR